MAGAVRHTPRPAGVPLSERGRLARMLCGSDWYLRPLSERGGRSQADGVCSGCNRRVCAGAVRHTPRPSGRTPLREGTADAHIIRLGLVSTSPLGEGWPPQADGVCSGCCCRGWLAQCDTPPALTGVPLSERGRLARMLYTSQIGIHVPSRRGVAAERRSGCVPDADAVLWLAQCDTPPALAGVPLSERGRLTRTFLNF